MATFRNKIRLSRLVQQVKSGITMLFKGDVPKYITVDVMNQLCLGEKKITISMCDETLGRTLTSYLNEYHNYPNEYKWQTPFLEFAFMFVSEKINRTFKKFKDIDVEVVEINDVDKHIIIKMKVEKEKSNDEK